MSKIPTKKFINTPNSCVDDFLSGLVTWQGSNVILHPSNKRVVLRKDQENLAKSGAVALISGGGSGHEPFAGGFVGKNCLTAAVSGDIFAAPSSDNVADAIRAVKGPGGTVVFVINYTGDRLNFGMAVERVKVEHKDYPIEMVIIDDDVALEDKLDFTTGGRGLAGHTLVFQITGVLAEQEKVPIQRLVQEANRVVQNLGTFGVTLYPCSIPGKSHMFELGEDELELGLGVHGEPGCERTKMFPVKEMIDKILKKLVGCKRLQLTKDEKIAVLLNNLGGTTAMEMLILTNEILEWLDENDYEVVRFISGTLMTSFEGHGISISILKIVDPKWVDYLDTSSVLNRHWLSYQPVQKERNIQNGVQNVPKQEEISNLGVKLDPEESKTLQKCLQKAADALIASEHELNRLDSITGDGDCGSTMKTACDTILNNLNAGKLNFAYPMTLFLQLSKLFEKNVGGTTGALYALMLSSAAKAFENSCAQREFFESLKNGLEAIMKYGGAKPGYRTMVDPLHAAVNVENHPQKSDDWKRLVETALKTAQDTAKMSAKAGRASYTAENLQKEPDPGATAVGVWMKAIYEAYYEE